MSKKKDKVTINVIGGNAEDVTGSASLITYQNKTILFEFGMIQKGKNIYENYIYNKELLDKVKPKKIDYIFIGHAHCDHIGLIPALYKRNCGAEIIVPAGNLGILREMWLDSAFINQRDAEVLTSQKCKNFYPLYSEDDVWSALEHAIEKPFNQIHQIIDTSISYRFIHAGHILFSAQTEMFFSQSNHTKKVLFTSDLGNPQLKNSKIFVEDFQPVANATVVIGESTYALPTRNSTKKSLALDVDKIRTVINQYCINHKHRVLIPCFSLDRLPYMLWILYTLFGQDETFKVPICVDSPLGIRLLKAYQKELPEDMKEPFNDMLSWKNIRYIVEPEDSKAAIAEKTPKVIIASAGMLTAGRSVKWVQSILPESEDCICFIGYCSTNTLAYKIKHAEPNSTISINGKSVKNNCQIIDLKSFSSHMQNSDLLNYYSSINTEKIYLVHSNMNDKLIFKNDLEKKIEEKNKTTKVIAVNRSTIINI